ncbi:MAG: histidine phosphatase family protein [Prevotella sp.]
MTKTTLFLVRHGETFDNVNRIMQGQTQGRLNDNGIGQAEEVAKNMAGERIDAVVASDLRRAVQTAEIIAMPHGLEVVTTPLLRERDWGSFTGRYIPDLKDEKWPSDIESLDQLRYRACLFMDFIRENYAGRQVLAVGHGIINKAIQSVFFCKEMKDVKPMANAEIRVLEL